MTYETSAFEWLTQPCARPSDVWRDAARAHQSQLTKPAGSLGALETFAVELAGLQHTLMPNLDRVQLRIYAGDHGIAAAGVSAYPQAVTAQMIDNFSRGGAAVSVLARSIEAGFSVINLGTVQPLPPLEGVEACLIGAGTADFSQQAAMTWPQLEKAMSAGRDSLDQALKQGCDLFIAGEMGIGNTSSATVLAASVLQRTVAELAGPGTGLDGQQLARKITLLEQALALHAPHINSPLELLRRLGGFEIAAICAAYMRAAQRGVPVLVDGFITTAAALVACMLQPQCRDWMLFAHCSAEPGHQAMLEALEARPLLQLDMRLGEGSGAAVAVSLLRSACILHSQMATFSQAGVEGKA